MQPKKVSITAHSIINSDTSQAQTSIYNLESTVDDPSGSPAGDDDLVFQQLNDFCVLAGRTIRTRHSRRSRQNVSIFGKGEEELDTTC